MTTDPTDIYPDSVRALDMVLAALAAQAQSSGGFSADAIAHLTDVPRAPTVYLLAAIAHLVHYGTGTERERLSELFDRILVALRDSHAPRPGAPRPGDVVELLVAQPENHLVAGDILRVFWVDADDTADVGYETLDHDYLIFTVPIASLGAPRVPA